MPIRSFQARLLYLIIAVLVLLEAGTLVSVHFAGRHTLRETVAEELRVGGRVLGRVMQNRASQLVHTLGVLVADFAFRETVAMNDIPTVTDVLSNHGRRVDADALMLVSLEGVVTADTLGGRMVGKQFPFASLFQAAEEHDQATEMVLFENHPYQFVVVPVKAPLRIAWVCAGFEIDQAVIEDVSRLASLEVSLSNSAGSTLISTLPQQQLGELGAQMGEIDANETTLRLGGVSYATLREPLFTGGQSHVNAFLQRDLDKAREPFRLLELQIFGLSSLLLLIAVIAAVKFARTVSRPLQVLADGAGRVERGNYVSPVDVRRHDEIGQLATAFNQMQSAIAAREDQIMFQATHDALTGLPNRTRFVDRLRQSIASGGQAIMPGTQDPDRWDRLSSTSIGMIMLDVDRFKEVNDTLGHHFGDQLLIEIGRRLTQTVGSNAMVARLGGDEFAVQFFANGEQAATEMAARVGTAFDAPIALGDVSIDVNASLGIALYPAHAADADTLMKRADIAMYDAKKNQSGVAIYEAGRDEHSMRRLSLMMELRQAIARDELELYFQPKVDVRSERVVHAEALVRWNHARHGVMRPDEFIPLAEQSGRIGLITKWVIRKAITQCAMWRDEGIDLTVAVNLSALDLFDSELPTFISGLLSEAGLTPARLMLEITESAIMKDAAYATKVLRDLKRRGVCLAIDDFGTGYSSLAHLKRLPVDELKIDKSFVLNLTEAATDDLVIVRSTIELGHNMGLVVIAEGVETAESWRILERLGCDMAQGYFMSPPLAAPQFRTWLAESKWR